MSLGNAGKIPQQQKFLLSMQIVQWSVLIHRSKIISRSVAYIEDMHVSKRMFLMILVSDKAFIHVQFL